MEYPELKMVRKTLDVYGADPTEVLAALMRALAHDHQRKAPNRRRTVLKQAFKIARRGFTPHCNVGRNSDPADQLADDLAHPLDTAGEILAICLDYADAFVPEPGDPPLGVELEQVRRTRAS